jgi:ubiquinone/menaquinone biosynthesis C-methylase UbiE
MSEHKSKNVFDFQAQVGITKHMGNVAATDELAALCHVDQDSRVLDVGCGVGASAVYLARTYGCRVVGVDIMEQMVQRAIERAARAGMSDRTTFRVADAQELPFDDATFDAALTESVTVFPADKEQAVREYARVTRPGGYVGLSETTWLQAPPPPEIRAWVDDDLSKHADPLTAEGWQGLLAGAGLEEVTAQVHAIDVRSEARGTLRRYGCAGLIGILGRTLLLYLRDPDYRAFFQEATGGSGAMPDNLSQYLGYGLYVGRKP